MKCRRVLVVEDPLVRRLIHGILTRAGYTVVQAEPWRAFELLRDPVETFALLITNQPYLFLDFTRNMPVLYVAATPDPEWVAILPNCRSLHKPFRPQELIGLTREMLSEACPAAV